MAVMAGQPPVPWGLEGKHVLAYSSPGWGEGTPCIVGKRRDSKSPYQTDTQSSLCLKKKKKMLGHGILEALSFVSPWGRGNGFLD